MNVITMEDLTNELEKALADKTVTPKETVIGTVGTAVLVVGALVVARRWIDNRIDRRIKKSQK
jgi:heme O synthase-like polyprenyltransferase